MSEVAESSPETISSPDTFCTSAFTYENDILVQHFKLTQFLSVDPNLAGDVKLVAVKSDSLQVGQQVLLGRGLWALVSNQPGKLVQLRARLRDALGGRDDVHRGLQPALAPGEVRHLHHDHAHVLRQHDHVVAIVVPLAHLEIVNVKKDPRVEKI